MNDEKEYKIELSGYKKIRNASLARTFPFLILTMITIIIVMEVKPTTPNPTTAYTSPFVILIMVLALVYSVYKSSKKIKEYCSSFRLTLRNDSIAAKSTLQEEVNIRFDEIQEIIKEHNGSITVKGNTQDKYIIISNHLEHYKEVESSLAKVREFSTGNSKVKIISISFLIKITVLILFVSLLILENKILIGICGTTLVTLLIYSSYKLIKSEVRSKVLTRLKLVSILVILSIIFILADKLFK